MPSNATSSSVSAPDSITVNRDNLARVIHFVGIVDAKAQFVLTLVLALTAYLVTELGSFFGAERAHIASRGLVLAAFAFMDIVLGACVVLFVFALLKVLEAITPRVKPYSGNTSLLFFRTIDSMPRDEFKQRMSGLSAAQLTNELIDQTYDNAKVVTRKAADVRKSIVYFKLGLLAFGIFTLVHPLLLALVAK